MADNKVGALQQWLNKNRDLFPVGTKFTSAVLKDAGRKLKEAEKNNVNIDAKLITILSSGANKGNVQPPAKCNIIGYSRPLSEWPIHLVNQEVQKFVFDLPYDPNTWNQNKPGDSSEKHQEWFKNNNVNNCGYSHVGGLNKIFNNAYNTYIGVLTKTENKNKKILAKNEAKKKIGIDRSDDIESALDANNKLIHPPFSISSDEKKNPNPVHKIHLYKDTAQALLNKKIKAHQELISQILEKYPEFKDCSLDDIILQQQDRLSINRGEPGFVPYHQRPMLSKNKKRIRSYTGPSNTLLGLIKVSHDSGFDWLLFDMRGLLRNARFRGLSCSELNQETDTWYQSKTKLLSLFSGDPIIHFKKPFVRTSKRKKKITDLGNVTFLYKEGTLSERKFDPKKEKLDLTNKTLISIDLGVTHPVSVKVSEVSSSDGGFIPTEKDKFTFKDLNLTLFKNNQELCIVQHLHSLSDQVEKKLLAEAVLMLPAEQQLKVKEFNESKQIDAKTKLCQEFNFEPNEFNWDQMSSNTNYISSKLLTRDANDLSLYWPAEGKNKKMRLKNDYYWARKYSPLLDKDIRNQLNSNLWELKMKATEYAAISKRKDEIAQMIVNKIKKRAQQATQCTNDELVFNIENLQNLNKIFSGKGKRLIGWDNYFKPKQENRWLIAALKKAITNLADKGFKIKLNNPAYTSRVCPDCEHYHHDNRNGEQFKCLNCGWEGHADLDVATTNLEKIACRNKKVAEWAKGI